MANPQSSYDNTRLSQGSFWARKQDVMRKSTIPFQLQMLKETGRYDAFDLKWQDQYADPPVVWPVPNHLFFDSDVAKWIEGVCYLLKDGDVSFDLDEPISHLVKLMSAAQQADGYLNIHYTAVEPGKRFTNLRDMHELYNAGHLIEAAMIHQKKYRNNDFLGPILKYADLLCKTFGPSEGQIHGYPGHPQIELALVRLYKHTKQQQYLDLARYFIEERGNPQGVDGQHYFDYESVARNEYEYSMPQYYPARRSYWYHQAHKPLHEQETIEGHSVRATYLLTGATDIATIDDEFKAKYLPTILRLWSNMVDKKMYITGGIGAIAQWEGFGVDYFLPQGSDEGGCYAETCAGIGAVMLAERLLQLDLDAKYADVLELILYNSILTGVSLSGREFAYDNQLATSDKKLSQRQEWFWCACCPPNMIRLVGTLGGYLWSWHQTGPSSVLIDVHLYTSSTLSFDIEGKKVSLEQQTDWPWDGNIHFSLEADPSVNVTVQLRIPTWATSWTIKPKTSQRLIKGYLTLSSEVLRQNPKFSVCIPLQPRLISPHPYTNQLVVAVARGPIVYCAEDVDNQWVPDDHFKSTVFDPAAKLEEFNLSSLPGDEKCVGIRAANAVRLLQPQDVDGPSHRSASLNLSPKAETIVFIPYYARANRGGKGMMRVGLRKAV